MKTVIIALILLFSLPVFSTEMSGGIYSIEVSATTSGGGNISDSSSQFSLWSALSQPTSIGKIDGTGSEHLFAGIYSPVIPEPATLLFFSVFVAAFFLRRK